MRGKLTEFRWLATGGGDSPDNARPINGKAGTGLLEIELHHRIGNRDQERRLPRAGAIHPHEVASFQRARFRPNDGAPKHVAAKANSLN
jgi:hypothetical protein